MTALRLCYLMIALLVFQTAGTSYDSHVEIQDLATHIPPHHVAGVNEDPVGDVTKNVPTKVLSASSAVTSVAPHDGVAALGSAETGFCHHCCHCHGCTFAGLPGHGVQSPGLGALQYRKIATVTVPSGYFTALYRPPIARA